ncbi:MAG: murein biosynthesis integral membrane protein MurJ [Myxococcales bacterium]|nr:murein biosynthesis integral membrane protein MurJ [Myxococcales bacterium]MCB9709278.1 murein biosynthesis integral membrane protein MurJ [Myxococcales bacterium]
MSSLSKSAATVASGTLISRVLGAIRDAVVAATFTVHATDAFFIAFTIPNSLRVLLGEGAVSAAFVPVLADIRETRREDYQKVFRALAGMMGLILFATTALGMIFSPELVTLYAAGYLAKPEQFHLTVTLTRLVFPYVFLVGMSALLTASLNTLGKFALPSLSPVWLNVALIIGALTLPAFFAHAGMPTILALAVGVWVGGLLQIVSQLPTLHRQKLLGTPQLDWKEPAVKKALRLLVPLLAGLGVYQLNVMGSRLFASFLAEGSQSFLYYSQRLVEIPQGMIALAISSAALPTLAQQRSRGEHGESAATLKEALRLCLFFTLPATAFLMAFGYPTVSVLLGRGNFDPSYVEQTARALFWQAAGIWSIATIRTLVPAFHAHNDTRSPVLGSVANLIVFITSAWWLMKFMQHAGIALAISLAGLAQLGTMLVLLRKHPMHAAFRGLGKSTLRMALSSSVMAAFLWAASRSMAWTHAGTRPGAMIAYVLISLVGLAIYFALSWIMGSPEMHSVLRAIGRKRRVPP